MKKRIGKLLLPDRYVMDHPPAELRSLFSIFYPYKIMSLALDRGMVLMYGISPFFEERPDDPRKYGYPTYEPIYKDGEYGREVIGFQKVNYKVKYFNK